MLFLSAAVFATAVVNYHETREREIGKYAPALNCGMVDPETTIPKFLEALEDAGMSKIVKENQKQLDAWLAENNK